MIWLEDLMKAKGVFLGGEVRSKRNRLRTMNTSYYR